jgi:hypothetical protein
MLSAIPSPSRSGPRDSGRCEALGTTGALGSGTISTLRAGAPPHAATAIHEATHAERIHAGIAPPYAYVRSVRAAWVALVLLGACGARTELASPERDASVAVDASLDVHEERNCPFDCLIGHECCAGSCSGPAVPMPNDCCMCLPGEVNSMTCNNHDHCGQ